MESGRTYRYSETKHPTYVVKWNEHDFQEGKIIKGWWIYDSPQDSCFVVPDPTLLRGTGWIQVLCCFLFCFPCTCVPCFFSVNYDGFQIPIFEEPTFVQPSAPDLPLFEHYRTYDT